MKKRIIHYDEVKFRLTILLILENSQTNQDINKFTQTYSYSKEKNYHIFKLKTNEGMDGEGVRGIRLVEEENKKMLAYLVHLVLWMEQKKKKKDRLR